MHLKKQTIKMEQKKSEKIAVIRIVGQIGIQRKIKETLNRLGIKKKYNCVIIDGSDESQRGMVKSVNDFVAFGEIDEETYKELVEKRKTKIKNFFRLHPPRGGIKSKIHFPKGVLGNHKNKINSLIMRML